ncbi:MAG TPA: hypothetical protein VGJ39_02110 [Vicinamibacterales bacterium]|jgi:hypothetical protein
MPIDVGGDDSVIWKVHADRTRSTKTSSAGQVHDQEGIDETGEKGCFTVTIKLPTDSAERSNFVAQLNNFVANPKGPLILRFPIEDKAYRKAKTGKGKKGVHDQINVSWPK